jgi:hypothetical protein
LLPFNPEPYVFPSVVKKPKNENTEDYNFACDFVWVRNLGLTLREEHRLRVFGNKVLRRIFGPKRDEVTGEWRKLRNEELRDLYFSPSKIRTIKPRRMWWAEHVARMGEKRPLGIPRRRWVDNIKIDLLEVGWSGVDWIGLAQDRDKWRALVSAIMSLRVP